MNCLQSGNYELAKGMWHVGGLVFAAGAALYNLSALVQRREIHLAANAAVYVGLTVYEASKVAHHFEDR